MFLLYKRLLLLFAGVLEHNTVRITSFILELPGVTYDVFHMQVFCM